MAKTDWLYRGFRAGAGCVVLKASGFKLDPAFGLCDHSPDGFEWGYDGSGPAQLAFAILYDAYGYDTARESHQAFKQEVIAKLEGDQWTLSSTQITQAMERIRSGMPPVEMNVEDDLPF